MRRPLRVPEEFKTRVEDDTKLPGASEEVLISERSGWRFDLCYKIFSLAT
jgi:hypothetical protein